VNEVVGKSAFSSSFTQTTRTTIPFSSFPKRTLCINQSYARTAKKRIRRAITEHTKETMTLQLGSAETAALFQDTNATDEVSLPYIDNISPHELKAAETMVKEEVSYTFSVAVRDFYFYSPSLSLSVRVSRVFSFETHHSLTSAFSLSLFLS
jgi:hypothetical protein